MMNIFRKPILSKSELRKISSLIAEMEKGTTGEIRVSVHRHRTNKERGLSLRDLALRNFYTLGMDRTEEKTGVLIFLCFKDRAFQIVADEGIHKKVPEKYWDTLATGMSLHFKEQKFCDGICHAVREIGGVLQKEFPSEGGGVNELSNEVSLS